MTKPLDVRSRNLLNLLVKNRRRLAASALAATLLAGAMALPANAAQSELSKIVFGTIYNDNVTVIDATRSGRRQGSDIPLTVTYASSERIRAAQAEVNASPALREALQKRNIRVQNVIWVQTALNGGKVVYIK